MGRVQGTREAQNLLSKLGPVLKLVTNNLSCKAGTTGPEYVPDAPGHPPKVHSGRRRGNEYKLQKGKL